MMVLQPLYLIVWMLGGIAFIIVSGMNKEPMVRVGFGLMGGTVVVVGLLQSASFVG